MTTFARLCVVIAVVWSASPARAATVAVRVNGVPITADQVKDLTEKMAAAQGAGAGPPETLRASAMQELIDTEVLVQEAKAEKIEVPAAEVDQHVATMRQRYETVEAFREALKNLHGTEADLRRDIGRSLLIQKLFDRHVSVHLDADTAEKFYNENGDQFQHPAQVRASHILFSVPEGGDEAAAKQRAQAALARLQKGEDFATLAKQLSEDPSSAESGGDLDFLSRDEMVPAFADVVFRLKPGELSEVVQTPFGFHIVKLTATREAGPIPFADVKPQIEEFLQDQARSKQEQAYLAQLKAQAKIEIADAAKTPTPEDKH